MASTDHTAASGGIPHEGQGPEGPEAPYGSQQAALGYLEGCNPAKAWLEQNYFIDVTKTKEINMRVRVGELYALYKGATDEPVDQASFNAGVEAAGLTKRKVSNWFWCGLRPLSDEEKVDMQADAEKEEALECQQA